MKKILIALLAFAIAGGGVFAQGWTFSGFVDGGLGVFFLEDGDFDDPILAPVTGEWDQGFSTRLFVQYVNPDGNAGLHFNLRANNVRQGGPATGAPAGGGLGIHFDWAYGWLTFADGMVRLQGGRVNNGFFNALDRMWGANHGWGLGAFATVRAMENLYFGFGAFTGGPILFEATAPATWTTSAPVLDPQGGPNGNHPQGVFYLSYLMPNLFRVTAGVSNRTYTAWTNRLSGPDMNGSPGLESQAHLSFAFLGDPALHAALTARFRNFEDFADSGIMNIYATFGHTGLVNGLDLRLGASVGMFMGDEIWVGTRTTTGLPPGTQGTPGAGGEQNTNPDMHVWIWLGAYYALNDVLMPRFDAHFIMGGIAAPPDANGDPLLLSLNHGRIRDSETWNSDDMSVLLRPAVRFNVTPMAFFEIGGLISIDLGDDDRDGAWLSGHGVNAAAYALMRVQF